MVHKTTKPSKIKTWLYDESVASKRLTVATVTMQCDSEPAKNLATIIDNIDRMMQKHPDINLVLFGEMILGHYNPGANPIYHREISDAIPGETTRALSIQARQHSIYICFGISENNKGQLHNTQVLINPQGEIQVCHRKWNLKPGEIQAGYKPGNRTVTFTEIRGIKTGLMICSDATHPQTMLTLLKHRPELVLFSLADDEDKDWFVAKANACLYNAWIVSANRFGQEQNYWNGHTIISDPLGKLRATSLHQAGYLIYDIGFIHQHSVIKRLIRNLWMKTSLLLHILTHLKTFRSYYK